MLLAQKCCICINLKHRALASGALVVKLRLNFALTRARKTAPVLKRSYACACMLSSRLLCARTRASPSLASIYRRLLALVGAYAKKMLLAQSLGRARGVADNDSAASTSLVRVRAILQRLFFSFIAQSLARVRAGSFRLNLASLAKFWLARVRATFV